MRGCGGVTLLYIAKNYHAQQGRGMPRPQTVDKPNETIANFR